MVIASRDTCGVSTHHSSGDRWEARRTSHSGFLSELAPAEALLEVSRSVYNAWHLRYRPRVRQAVQRAAKIYAANTQNQTDFCKAHGRTPELQLETGIDQLPEVSIRERQSQEPLRILWSGRFKHWKGLPLLLRALQGLDAAAAYELRIIGYQSGEKIAT